MCITLEFTKNIININEFNPFICWALEFIRCQLKRCESDTELAPFFFGNFCYYLTFDKIKKAHKHSVYRLLVEFDKFLAENEGFEPPEV